MIDFIPSILALIYIIFFWSSYSNWPEAVLYLQKRILFLI